MVGAGAAVVVRTAHDAVYRLSLESGNVVRARRSDCQVSENGGYSSTSSSM